jgi:hypothetical protein
MKPILAWFLIIQIGLSSPLSDTHHVESLQPRQDERTTHTGPTTSFHNDPPSSELGTVSPHLGQDEEAIQASHAAELNTDDPSSEPRDASLHSTTVEGRDEEPPKIMRCTVRVTDMFNKTQIDETRKWLEGLVKGSPKLDEHTTLPWAHDEIPHDDIDRWIAEGIFDEEMDKAEVVTGWGNVYLDDAGFEEVKNKIEWISSVEDMARYRCAECRAFSKSKVKTHRAFNPRDVN